MLTDFISEETVLNNTRLRKLRKILCVTPKDVKQGYITDIWHDCDYIKTDKNQWRGKYEFIDIKLKTKRYIIIRHDSDLDISELNMLKAFFENSFKDSFKSCEPNTWHAWDNIEKGIAYRGGSGYVYSLWIYNKAA